MLSNNVYLGKIFSVVQHIMMSPTYFTVLLLLLLLLLLQLLLVLTISLIKITGVTSLKLCWKLTEITKLSMTTYSHFCETQERDLVRTHIYRSGKECLERKLQIKNKIHTLCDKYVRWATNISRTPRYQDRQSTYYLTFRNVPVTIVAVEKQ
jgi:hypothetical protein